ncbi:MAG: [Fe-Fe] hydrogenase large subunit C-terminal domain-containing protein [Bacillota bacterium]
MSEKHSVLLKEDKCEGCTNCVKNCPTRAIRVHQGKATIKEDLCIDCSECIRTCEYHAKYTETNSFQDIDDYSYPVALIPPSFYGQFKDSVSPASVIGGLEQLGFKEVHDVALAAEAISRKTAEFLNNNYGFYLSSSCPVVVRLIKKLYPELLDYLIPFKSPVQLMAQKVTADIRERQGLKRDEIGVFFITPCPAKLTTVKSPLGVEQSYLDGAIAVDRVYSRLINLWEEEGKDQLEVEDYTPPLQGIGWGQNGGEENILRQEEQYQTLSVSGIHNIKGVLEEISRNNIKGIKYFELVACPQGCVGGILNVTNPFQARYNIQRLIREQGQQQLLSQDLSSYSFEIEGNFEPEDVGSLDQDISKAMDKLSRVEREMEILPGLDCAACGAPDCRTLAEDIVNGLAQRSDCIFMLRQEVSELADKLSSLTHEVPPVMGSKRRKQSDDSQRNSGATGSGNSSSQ